MIQKKKIHPAAYQLADKISKSNKSQTNRDYEKLKNLHDRLAQSRENVLSGTGGKGSFSKNCFGALDAWSTKY